MCGLFQAPFFFPPPREDTLSVSLHFLQTLGCASETASKVTWPFLLTTGDLHSGMSPFQGVTESDKQGSEADWEQERVIAQDVFLATSNRICHHSLRYSIAWNPEARVSTDVSWARLSPLARHCPSFSSALLSIVLVIPKAIFSQSQGGCYSSIRCVLPCNIWLNIPQGVDLFPNKLPQTLQLKTTQICHFTARSQKSKMGLRAKIMLAVLSSF